MTATDHAYAFTWQQRERLSSHPRVTSKFALDKGLWDGRRVAVISITRGNAHTHTRRRVYYGTLVLDAGRPDQIGVRHDDDEVTIIHITRAVDVYDLTRTNPEKSTR